MASLIGEKLSSCLGSCCQSVGKIVTVPLEILRELPRRASFREKCRDGGRLLVCCGSSFCCYVTVACVLNVPSILLGFSDLHNFAQGCPASDWLGVFWIFGVGHIWAAFYIMARVGAIAEETSGDGDASSRSRGTRQLFCHDGWMALYFLVCCGYLAWLFLGAGLFVGVTVSTSDTCTGLSIGMLGIAYCFGWAFVIFGGCALCCSLGCGYIDDAGDTNQHHDSKPPKKPSQLQDTSTISTTDMDVPQPSIRQWQLALCYLAFTTTYLMANTIPYAPFLAVNLLPGHATPENVGKFSAFFTSCYIWGRSAGAGFWGRVADLRGRKPILLSSVIAGGIFTLLFGLSNNYFLALAMRFCMGLFSDVASLVKTSVSEHAAHDRHLEAHSMNLVISAWAAGSLLAPAIGGALSDPVENFPGSIPFLESIGMKEFLQTFPYFLPNLVGFLLSAGGVVVTQLYVSETLVRKTKKNPQQSAGPFLEKGDNEVVTERSRLLPLNDDGDNQYGDDFVQIGPEALKFARESKISSTLRDSYMFSDDFEGAMTNDEFRTSFAKRSSAGNAGPARGPFTKSKRQLSIKSTIPEEENEDEHEVPVGPPTTMTFLLDPETRNHMIVYCIGCFVICFHMEVFPLFCLSQDSGLGVSESTIGGIMLASGITHALLQPTIYGFIFARTGLKGSIRWAATCVIPVFLIVPASLLSKGVGDDDLRWTALIFLGVIIGLGRTFTVTFASSMSVSLNHLVIPAHRATFNGLLTKISGGCKGSAPVLAGFFTAWAFTSGVVPSHGWGAVLLYCSLGLVGVILAAASHLLLGHDEHF